MFAIIFYPAIGWLYLFFKYRNFHEMRHTINEAFDGSYFNVGEYLIGKAGELRFNLLFYFTGILLFAAWIGVILLGVIFTWMAFNNYINGIIFYLFS